MHRHAPTNVHGLVPLHIRPDVSCLDLGPLIRAVQDFFESVL